MAASNPWWMIPGYEAKSSLPHGCSTRIKSLAMVSVVRSTGCLHNLQMYANPVQSDLANIPSIGKKLRQHLRHKQTFIGAFDYCNIIAKPIENRQLFISKSIDRPKYPDRS